MRTREKRYHRLVDQVKETLVGQIGDGTGRKKILVALSGGADSVFLLHALVQIAAEMEGLQLVAAHIDHGIRRESGGDARWARSLARSLGLEFHLGTIPPGTIGPTGLEGTARTLRYQLLSELAVRCGADFIATGHSASDQAETLLMRLVRGASLPGLCGIRPVQTGLGPVPVIRPILGVVRADLEGWLGERGIDYLEDATNRDQSITRNRIRHQLVPLLRESFNPSIERVLARVAANLADEDRAMEALLAREFPGEPAVGGGGKGSGAGATPGQVHLDLEQLRGLPRAGVVRVIRKQLAAGGLNPPLTRAHWSRLYQLTRKINGPRTKFPLPGGLVAIKEYASLRIGPALGGEEGAEGACRTEPVTVPLGSLEQQVVRTVRWGDRTLRFQVKPGGEVATDSLDERARVVFALDQVTSPVRIRGWHHGDVMAPFGGPGTRKVKKIFGDLKVPPGERPLVPVVESPEGILWLAGVRRSRCAPLPRVANPCQPVLEITLEPRPGPGAGEGGP